MLRSFFDSATHDLRTSGILLDFGDAEIYLFASHECTIADYKAHTEIVSSRGVAASKPCPCCRRVCDNRHGVADGSAQLVSLTSLERGDWKQHTDESVRAVVHRLRAAHGTHEFDAMQQMHGYTHNPLSIHFNEHLKYGPISTMLYDWPHCAIIDGVLETTLDQLLLAFGRKKKTNCGEVC